MDTRPRHLALFAGAGGSELAAQLLGWQTVAAVEWDAFCARVLVERQRVGMLDTYPIWDDVQTFDGRPWRGCVDVVTAGFPCQPFSVAGNQTAANDPRNMWPHTRRLLNEIRPACALLENVRGLLGSHGYFGSILTDLAAIGFDAEWCVLGADEVGAPHVRKRLWVLAIDTNADRGRLERISETPARWDRLRHANERRNDAHRLRDVPGPDSTIATGQRRGTPATHARDGVSGQHVADSDGKRREERRGSATVCTQHATPQRSSSGTSRRWQAEPHVGRVVDGLACQVDGGSADPAITVRRARLRALGNGWVPQVAAVAWSRLWHRYWNGAHPR